MGSHGLTSQSCSIVAKKAINTARYLPRIWKRYSHDTLVIQKIVSKENSWKWKPLIQLLSSQLKEIRPDGSMFFMGALIKQELDRMLSISVCRNTYIGIDTMLCQSYQYISA